MHLLIPFASELSEACSEVLRDLALPQLSRLLPMLSAAPVDAGDEHSLSPPHERALAAAWGWYGGDGHWPFAALAAAGDGIALDGRACGLVTPAHWHVAADHVALADPDALQLDEAESRAFFDAVRDLFESEGLALTWGAATLWYATHESLADLPCASLDRVIGRNLAPWTQNDAVTDPNQRRTLRLMQRLQSEAQMRLYPHALNEAREARGALAVNSFWLSGCGAPQTAGVPAVQVDHRLRSPCLARDWAAWAEAWQALDREPIAGLLARAERGEPLALTLCGERSAQRFENLPRGLWQKLAGRWTAPSPHTVLEAL